MFIPYTIVIAALILPPLAVAQQAAPDPADPGESVPALHYESVFSSYRSFSAAAAAETAPDRVWHSANREVGELGGHAGHLRAAPERNAADVRATVPATDAPAPPSRPAGHGKHH